jgi:hypothetical protein
VADILNLNRERKAKARAAAQVQAARNRVAFGLPKAGKAASRAAKAKAEASLDGHKREP